MNRVTHVELLGERRQIISVGVHVVAVPGLARTPVPATVMRDAPIAVRGQEEHLILVGSADKIELLPPLRQQYGSNASLARLRAETVRRAVEAVLGRAVSTVALATGPEVQGAGLTSSATRADRSVAVYAAWWSAPTAAH